MFRLQYTPLDEAALKALLRSPEAGACVSFEGWVRNHHEGRRVRGLFYEAYELLALTEGEKIVAEARERFDCTEVVCVHRLGELAVGETAVWVGASAPHRSEAFDACRYVIDTVKHTVPIWKKEHYTDGTSAWVRCEHCAQAHEY